MLGPGRHVRGGGGADYHCQSPGCRLCKAAPTSCPQSRAAMQEQLSWQLDIASGAPTYVVPHPIHPTPFAHPPRTLPRDSGP